MPASAYLFCPKCRGEYTQSASRCIECDLPLVAEHELPSDAGQPLVLPPASELCCVRVAPIAWIRALSGALREQDVAHRVEPATTADAPDGQRPDVFGDVQLFGLYLREADAEAARSLDATLAARLVPEEAAPLEEGEEEACPACGTPLVVEASSCSDCGLEFA